MAGAGDADLAATARNGPLRELLTSAASVRGPAGGRVRRTIAGASRVAEGLWIHREARDAAVEKLNDELLARRAWTRHQVLGSVTTDVARRRAASSTSSSVQARPRSTAVSAAARSRRAHAHHP